MNRGPLDLQSNALPLSYTPYILFYILLKKIINAVELATNDWTRAEWRSFGVRLDKKACSTEDVLVALREFVV